MAFLLYNRILVYTYLHLQDIITLTNVYSKFRVLQKIRFLILPRGTMIISSVYKLQNEVVDDVVHLPLIFTKP